MSRFIQQSCWIKWVSVGFYSVVLALSPAFAEDLSKVTNIQAKPGTNQIILKLSSPNEGVLVSPLEKGQRSLVVDIKGASLADMPNKQDMLRTIADELGDVTQVTLDEFRGDTPIVRMVVKTKSPEITGALIEPQGDTMVLQILRPVASNTTTPSAEADNAILDSVSTNQKDVPPSNLDKPIVIPQPVLSGQTSISVPDRKMQHKIDEAETLRYERNRLLSQVERLTIQVDQQNEMIAHLKKEQTILAQREPSKVAKQNVYALQSQLQELQKSYDEMKHMLEVYQKDIVNLESDQNRASLNAKNNPAPQPNRIQLPEAAETRGSLLNTLDQLTQAELNKLLDAEKSYREGKKAELNKDAKTAESKYKAALQTAPQVKEYALALGGLYISEREYPKARTVLSTALTYHPDDTAILNELGKAALLQKDMDGAVTYFRSALPAGVLSNYASALRKNNDLENAESFYKMALTLSPNDSDLQFNLGNLYLSQQRFNEAFERYTEALRINPDFAEARFHMGLVYAEQGKYNNAIAEFENYLRLMPDVPNKSVVKNYMHDIQKVMKRQQTEKKAEQ